MSRASTFQDTGSPSGWEKDMLPLFILNSTIILFFVVVVWTKGYILNVSESVAVLHSSICQEQYSELLCHSPLAGPFPCVRLGWGTTDMVLEDLQ